LPVFVLAELPRSPLGRANLGAVVQQPPILKSALRGPEDPPDPLDLPDLKDFKDLKE